MKKLLYLFALLCMATGFTSSCKESALDRSLSQAGDNRKELEAVLLHYQNDTLKQQAARFLIENMDAHYCFGGDAVEKYYHAMDSVFRHGKGDRAYWNRQYDSILGQTGQALDSCMAVPLFDIEHVKADFLIAHIDSAFAVWHRNWNRQYSFEMFLRYVLPYRIGHEGLSLWRGKYPLPQEEEEDYERNTFNSNFVYGIAHATFLGMQPWIYYSDRQLPEFPLGQLMHIKAAICREYAHLNVASFRAQGIPATVDFTPQWGNRAMGHEWCVFFINNETAIPFEMGQPVGCHFMKRKEDRLPKVFRETFEKQETSLFMKNKGKESLPPVFNTPYLVDVTNQYIETSDIEVNLYSMETNRHSDYVYLAVFDNHTWKIVHWSKISRGKALFTDMGRDIVYLPVYYIEDKIIPAGDAFLLNNKGEKVLLKADDTKKTTIKVKRKYRNIRTNVFLRDIVGGKFQVANRKDFSDSLTLYTIPLLEDNHFQIIKTPNKSKFKYFRYLSPNGSRGNMAELYTFDEKGDTLYPIRFMNNSTTLSEHDMKTLTDGDVLTYYEAEGTENIWYGWEYSQPVNLSCIVFLPRNDDNFIREGETYELFYWSHNGWISLGKQKGNLASELVFSNAPLHALFWLHNHDKGTEERIFTYENERQIWR